MRGAMKSASPEEVPARAFELARALEERLGMPAAMYIMPAPRHMTSRRSTSGSPARSITAAASPETKPDRRPSQRPRFGRSIGSAEVAGAIIAAFLFGLLATGLGWLAAGSL